MGEFKVGDKVQFQVIADNNDFPRWSFQEDRMFSQICAPMRRSNGTDVWRTGEVTELGKYGSGEEYIYVRHVMPGTGEEVMWRWPNNETWYKEKLIPGYIRKVK